MFTGRSKYTWDHTATIWQVVAEVNRNGETRAEPFTVYDIHPYRKKAEMSGQQESSGFWTRIKQARMFDGDGRDAVISSLFHGR